MAKCININHPDYIDLLQESGLHEDVLKAKISIWMEENGEDRIPALEELAISPLMPVTQERLNQVQELFESNPELANAVYEALGFKEKLSSITPKVSITNYRTMDDKSKKDAIDGVEEAQRRWVEEEIAEFYEAVHQYNNNLDTFSSKGVNKGKATIDDVIDETLGIFRTIQMFPKFSDLILPYIDDIQIAIDSFGRKEGYAIYKAKKDKKGQAKEMTYENLFEVVDKYMKPFQITPQQKQQAQQLYSQYLEQNPNGSVEQFKSWVDEFNRNNQKLNSNVQIFSNNKEGNFDSSSLKNDDLALMLFNQALGLNLTSVNQLTWDNIKDNIFFEKEDGSLGVKNLAFVGGNLLSTKRITLNNFLNQKGLFPEYKVFIGESVIYPNVFEVLEENEIIKQAIFENLFNLSGAFEQVKKELNNHSPETFVIETPHGKFTFPKRFASGFFKIASTVELLLKENQSSYIQDYLYSKRKKEEAVKDGKKVKPVITQTLTVNDTIVQNAIGLIGNSIIENAIKNNTSVKIQVFSNAEYSEDGVAGWYITTENTIYLHESMLNPQHLSEGLPLITHELLHSVTSQSLLYDEEFSKSIRALLKIVKDKSNIKDFYGFKNEHEFLSEAFSSQEFRQLLKNTKFEGIEELSIWQKFINAILKLFGKNVKYTKKSTLVTAEEILNDIINDNQYKIQYIKSNIIDKFNTHKSLSDFITQKSQERLNQIKDVFNENPELNRIGTIQQYASYLDTIFPDSKVKDIVVHGAGADFEKFDKSFYSSGDPDYIYFGIKGKPGFKSFAKRTVYALVNIKNPNKFIDNTSEKVENPDGFVEDYTSEFFNNLTEDQEYGGEFLTQIGVKEPEQIHILGSKKDIEKFKNWIGINNVLPSQKLLDNLQFKKGDC